MPATGMQYKCQREGINTSVVGTKLHRIPVITTEKQLLVLLGESLIWP